MRNYAGPDVRTLHIAPIARNEMGGVRGWGSAIRISTPPRTAVDSELNGCLDD